MENKRQIISIILKLVIIVSAIYGIINLCLTSGPFNLLYFTLQSNIWIAVTCLVGIILILLEIKNNKTYIKKWMYILKFVFTISITITGLVFCFVLAPTLEAKFVFTLDNILLHIVVPIFAIVDFFYFDCKIEYKKKYAILTIIPFLYYLCFSTVGYLCEWDFGYNQHYPYFFLNWDSPAGIIGFSSELPFMAPPYWGTLLLILVVLLARLYIKFVNKNYIKNNKFNKNK